jgi:hypothetical protein
LLERVLDPRVRVQQVQHQLQRVAIQVHVQPGDQATSFKASSRQFFFSHELDEFLRNFFANASEA